MAIQTQDLLLKLGPLGGLSGGGGGDSSKMERERLRLMRQQFEETKRQNALDEQYRREHEANEMTRAQLMVQKQREKDAAAAAAKLQENKLAALQKFQELNGAGKYEEAAALVPQMTMLGMGVDKLGDENGLPAYAINMDAQAAAAEEAKRAAQTASYGETETAEQSLSRLGAMGYPSTDSGVLNEPAGISESLGPAKLALEGGELDPSVQEALDLDSGDAIRHPSVETDLGPNAGAYGQMLAASASALDKGALQGGSAPLPTRGRDEEDYTGGVPKNVLDMGAIQAQTLARLNPAFEAITQSYPEQFRSSMEKTATGVKALGLPAVEAVKLADQLRGGGPDSLIAAQLAADAQKQKGEDPDLMQRNQLYQSGYGNAAKAAEKFDLKRVIERRGEVSLGVQRLTNEDKSDDHLVGALVSRLMGERGSTTEPDVQRALGTAAMSFLDKIKTFAYGAAIGGLTAMQRKALLGVLRDRLEADKRTAFSFLQNADELAAAEGQNPEVARGVRAYRNVVVDKDIRDEYEKMRKPENEASGAPVFNDPEVITGSTGGLDQKTGATLDQLAASAGLNPAAVRTTVGRESGGRAGAVNAETGKHGGLLQFAKENWPKLAAAAGTPDVTWEDMLKMSPAEQAPYVVQYFKGTGVTDKDDAGEYAMAAFMPLYRKEKDDFVLGKKDSTEISYGNVTKGKVWEQNESLRDGDVITVGGVKRRGREASGRAAPTTEKPAREKLGITAVGAAGAPSTAAERLKRLREQEKR